MNNKSIEEWLKLPDQTKKNIYEDIGNKTAIPAAAIEKDWWVVRTLDLVFQMDVAPHLVFKGGTSLSKAWGLIDRLSEDIDLALDRGYLGFGEKLSRSQVKKLRESSFKYISEKFYPGLQDKFENSGFKQIKLVKSKITANDQDPLIIQVNYPSVTEKSEYLQPRVLIEIGSRSLIEPHTQRTFCSFIGEYYTDRDFADGKIMIPAVNPERTFLEKIFLLHENLQLSPNKVKIDRLSRHLYDIEKLMNTEYGIQALSDKTLYDLIVEHRKTIYFLRGIDYSKHSPDKIKIVPPDSVIENWEKDYNLMRESMIYKESLTFDQLIKRITSIQDKINKLKF